MKPSLLGLLIAAAAFGASTIYLAVQLDAERTTADRLLAESRALQARVAELEKLRAGVAVVPRVVSAATAQPLDPPVPGVSAPQSTTAVEVLDAAGVSQTVVKELPTPEQSEAMRKMMRAQIRAHHRRLYADLGASLDLTREDTSRLIDLLTDQQMRAMNGMRGRPPGTSPADLRRNDLDEIAGLIGYDKLESYKAYQETLPARQEAANIARQLEGLDLALDESQRQRLVTALGEERKRIPAPEYIPGTSREQYAESLQAWQDDYSERTASRMRGILSADQLASYNEQQQLQREMRAHFESRRPAGAREGAVMVAEPAAIAAPPR